MFDVVIGDGAVHHTAHLRPGDHDRSGGEARTGKLVHKLNVGPDGKAIARWPDFLSPCGAGACLIEGEKSLVVFGGDGKLLRKADIQGDDFSLAYSSVAGMVEVPGRGLYLYVGLPKEKGSSEKVADILRIENILK